MAQSAGHADRIFAAWDLIDAVVQGDTILIVTMTEGDDSALYL